MKIIIWELKDYMDITYKFDIEKTFGNHDEIRYNEIGNIIRSEDNWNWTIRNIVFSYGRNIIIVQCTLKA